MPREEGSGRSARRPKDSGAIMCLYALAALLLVKMLVDINSISMHGFTATGWLPPMA
jgi:hypothetical protein